jgi:hypothetical protein
MSRSCVPVAWLRFRFHVLCPRFTETNEFFQISPPAFANSQSTFIKTYNVEDSVSRTPLGPIGTDPRHSISRLQTPDVWTLNRISGVVALFDLRDHLVD